MVELNEEKKELLKKLEMKVLQMNKKMNIISKGDEIIIWGRHIIDSLQVLVKMGNDFKGAVLDMGSGYGFPVIPLAIVFPESKFIAIESRAKRVAVINYLKRELSLTNINVINDRVENVAPAAVYDFVTSRALGNIQDDVEMAIPFLKKGGAYLGYKTEKSDEKEFFEMKVENFKYEQASGEKNYYIVSVTK
ncbi:MAG: 16S rRNA (guanine(527)-N(7))-methyltransferase RsmG [Fibrobacterales bacterium]